jgi:hypothetical protein
MILQELIRNFILYREVVRPMLASWKDSFAAGYYREIASISSHELNMAINKVKALGDGEELGWDISDEYEATSVSQISGTRTITDSLTHPTYHFAIFNEAKMTFGSASVSKEIYIVLTSERLGNQAVKSGKTFTGEYISNSNVISLATLQNIYATTGYANQQINSILISETHEKREYLGEFSLTHEETPLMNFAEGGVYHEAY